MSSKDNKKYKPFLATDKDYLKKVAGTIKGKDPIEAISFNFLNEALTSLGFDENPYKLLTPENLNPEPLKELVEKSFLKINSEPLGDVVTQKLLRLWNYLAESDPLEQADLIFVFGGPGILRVNKAIELYNDKYANKILFTGQKASYMKDVDVSEAEYYAQIANQEGIPPEDIILETEAKNTPENAVNSAKILKSKNFLPKKIILITLPYHMRRSYLTLKAVADWNPKLIRHISPSAKYTRENYYTDKNGWSYVFFEYIKIYGARLMRHF